MEGQAFTVALLAHMKDGLDFKSPPTLQLCPCFCPSLLKSGTTGNLGIRRCKKRGAESLE